MNYFFQQILVVAASALFFSLPQALFAGPPFTTDDPEPVELHHWEVYVFRTYAKDPSGQTGQVPALEVNYGAVENLQLHLILPYAFSQAPQSDWRTGIGDMELGVKYRFAQETGQLPMAGIFPHIEIPFGSESRGLGAGHAQILIPLWLQKSYKHWTSYGGGGYLLNAGAADQDSWLAGWEIQKDLTEHLMLGGEILADPGAGFFTRRPISTWAGRSILTTSITCFFPRQEHTWQHRLHGLSRFSMDIRLGRI